MLTLFLHFEHVQRILEKKGSVNARKAAGLGIRTAFFERGLKAKKKITDLKLLRSELRLIKR